VQFEVPSPTYIGSQVQIPGYWQWASGWQSASQAKQPVGSVGEPKGKSESQTHWFDAVKIVFEAVQLVSEVQKMSRRYASEGDMVFPLSQF
jgi:hypothetical protein